MTATTRTTPEVRRGRYEAVIAAAPNPPPPRPTPRRRSSPLPQPLPLLLTIAQACAVIGISRAFFYEQVHAGRLQTISLSPQRVRVHIDEAQAYAERLRQEAAG